MNKPETSIDQLRSIHVLQNPIQPYAWGSLTAIPELLGSPSPASQPQAELWMGAHPKAPSRIRIVDRWVPLSDAIDQHPELFLGPEVAGRFKNHLPYLFKVLAATKALSIQAHPDKTTAARGYAGENTQGIPLNDGRRNYKDSNHKPECICALTPFWALCGFRSADTIAERLQRLCPNGLSDILEKLTSRSGEPCHKRFFLALLGLDPEDIKSVLNEAVTQARLLNHADPVCHWIIRLHEQFPRDIGVLAPAILNLVCLKPGEALYLPDGELHAYLEGTAMEVMANSDNVVRCGLTPKHVDVKELQRFVNFRERALEVIQPVARSASESVYITPAVEFELSRVRVNETLLYESPSTRSLEILFCVEGRSTIRSVGDDQYVALNRGRAVVVPAAVDAYCISGKAELYKTTVPL